MSLLNFDTISDFKIYLEEQIQYQKNNLENISKKVGEQLRNHEKELEEDKEFLAIKEKLEEKSNEKKSKSKKQSSINWIKYDSINLYNGMGIKGELELYFKDIEKLKSLLVKLDSTKQSLDTLISKGLKNNLKCLVFEDECFELVLLKMTQEPRKKFSFKKGFSVQTQFEKPLFSESVIR
ncbi:MAG: hypothetical protein RI100_03805 [Nitrosarchaeum sp.]|jgi:vacuolar-type H+-ATPase subunit I/STV1|uniref:hypothetical protein n=1 Tax=Nitrosarchaeum sp. TaxID=2026886 RepID=UPI002DEB74C7|nr:hypothetical protein [Nitrosarchaeum sp.]